MGYTTGKSSFCPRHPQPLFLLFIIYFSIISSFNLNEKSIGVHGEGEEFEKHSKARGCFKKEDKIWPKSRKTVPLPSQLSLWAVGVMERRLSPLEGLRLTTRRGERLRSVANIANMIWNAGKPIVGMIARVTCWEQSLGISKTAEVSQTKHLLTKSSIFNPTKRFSL